MRNSRRALGLLSIITVFTMISLSGCGDKVEMVADYDLTIDSVYGEITGTYNGELTNSEVTGEGVFKEENGNFTYEGHFEQGIFQGKGKLSGMNEYEEALDIEGAFEGLDSIKGTITANGQKRYSGALSQYKHNSTQSYTLLVDDFVYHGNGSLYNMNEEEVYKGKFEYGKPVDKNAFMKACKNYTTHDLQKYADTKVGSLVKVEYNDVYTDGGLLSNRNVFIYDTDGLTSINNGLVLLRYQYHKGETRIINGEKITAYGIVHGFLDGNPIIDVLVVKSAYDAFQAS